MATGPCCSTKANTRAGRSIAARLPPSAATRPRCSALKTLAWNVAGGAVHTLHGSQAGRLAYDALILATGATDRLYPVEGWTLPGVFSLGAAQVLLKDQGCLIGRNTVFCGSSPLLYVAAL